MQETRVCRTKGTHGGERQDAFEAHVYPASIPAGGEKGFAFSPFGLVIILSSFTTSVGGFHGLMQCFN